MRTRRYRVPRIVITTLRLVAVPADGRIEDLVVDATGRSDGELESVLLTTPTGLRIETFAKTGIRWTARGGAIAGDLRLEDAAAGVVAAALLDWIPPDRSREATRALVDAAMEEADRRGEDVWQRSVWAVRSLLVEDEAFAVFVTAVADGFAAVADLGPLRVTLRGPREASGVALRVVPASAFPRLDAGR